MNIVTPEQDEAMLRACYRQRYTFDSAEHACHTGEKFRESRMKGLLGYGALAEMLMSTEILDSISSLESSSPLLSQTLCSVYNRVAERVFQRLACVAFLTAEAVQPATAQVRYPWLYPGNFHERVRQADLVVSGTIGSTVPKATPEVFV